MRPVDWTAIWTAVSAPGHGSPENGDEESRVSGTQRTVSAGCVGVGGARGGLPRTLAHEGTDLRKLSQECEVESRGRLSKNATATLGNPELASSRALKNTGPAKVRERPMGAIIDEGLQATRKSLRPFFRGDREEHREVFNGFDGRVNVAVARQSQDRKHEVLEAWDGHRITIQVVGSV